MRQEGGAGATAASKPRGERDLNPLSAQVNTAKPVNPLTRTLNPSTKPKPKPKPWFQGLEVGTT